MNAQSPRFPLFDSLRAIAALSVVVFHIGFFLKALQSEFPGRFLAQLNIGVTIFFVISGFLLYRPFVHARFLGQPRPPLVPYAIRRVARIVPAYWVAVALIGLLLPIHAVFTAHGLLDYFGFASVYSLQSLGQLVLSGGLGHTWTLCVEMTFYVLLPLWMLAVRRLPARSTRQFVLTEALPLVAMFALGVVWSATQVTGNRVGEWSFTPSSATLPYYLNHFALGMGLAVASVALAGRERRPRVVRLVERASWVPWAAALAAYVALCVVGARFNSFGAEPVRHELRGLVAVCLLLPAVFGDHQSGAVRRLLADRRLQWIGLVSYSVFIWHLVVIRALHRSGVGSIGAVGFTIASIASTLVVAAVSFYVVERPALRLGRRLAGRRGYQETVHPPPGSRDAPGAPSIELAPADRV
jgi:peptidoglycan/LPS O-acetylase OafA/YrhL